MADLPDQQVAGIVERADGNAFYLEELIRAHSDGSGAGDRLPPDTVIGTIQARFETLGPEARRVLRAAAIFGHTFPSAGVARLLGGDDGQGVDRWLEVLGHKEIIFSRETSDSGELSFRHDLFQDAAYSMLTEDDLVLGHRLAAEYLEAAGEREAILLADHYERGKERKKAAHWCRFAAEQALEANDLAKAVARAQRGVHLGATGETLGATRLAEARAHFWRGEFREAEMAATVAAEILQGREHFRATYEVLSALGQQSRFVEVNELAARLRRECPEPGAMGAWLDCLVRAAAYLHPGGFYQAARDLIAEAETYGPHLEEASVARATSLKGLSAWYEGDYCAALDLFAAALQRYEKLGDLRSAIEMRMNSGTTFCFLGAFEEAAEQLLPAFAVAERLELGNLVAITSISLSYIHACTGDTKSARLAGERAVALLREQGDTRCEGAAHSQVAFVASLAGDFLLAETKARTAAALVEAVPPQLPMALALLAGSLLSQGRLADALEQARHGYQMLEKYGRVEDGEALIRLLYAKTLAAAGKSEESRDVLRKARAWLTACADAITNPVWRRSFLSRVPVHVEILALSEGLDVT
jgi:tetratricopeptide (TPR) repeat protein